MKTIYITEEQKKKLKKVISAQDQVGRKVNAGVMDSVVGIGENVESDTYKLGVDNDSIKNELSSNYHVNESNEEIITLYHGVNRKGLEYNIINGGFIPRVCSEGGPKAVWLSEKQYHYEFTFAFDIPKSVVHQLSNVDYIYENKIEFHEFNCRLIKTSIYTHLDDRRTVIETDILDDRLSKIQFRYFPDLGIKLWKSFKEYPNVLDVYINPYIKKYQKLSESKLNESAVDLEYHYTTLQNLISMMATDTFNLTDSKGEEGRKGDYYMSLTRMRSNAEGYGYGLRETSPLIRIELDGRLLNNIRNVDITPYDYIYANYEHFKEEWGDDLKRGRGRTDGGESNEAEDSLTLRDGSDQIVDASNYINRIDILLGNHVDNIKLWDKFLKRIETYPDWGEKMHFFTNMNDFNYQRNEIPRQKIYSIYSNQLKSMFEGKKVVKNDKGEIVPEKCDKCGGKVVLQIHGEPVYVCKDCGKYFGTMPFTLKENKLNESIEDLEDVFEERTHFELLDDFSLDKKHGIKQKQWNLIPAQQYHTLLKRYMESPVMARIPYNVVNNWFLNIIVPNAIDINNITDFAGHSGYFPIEDVCDYFGVDIEGYYDGSEYLDSIGFYDWCVLPDGSDAWSDYGLKPLFDIIKLYHPNMEAGEILILINRCLDVVHQRGDLSSAFIEGGKHSCDYISNSVTESKLNENIEVEDKWNGDKEKLEPLKRLKIVPPVLYHASYKRNRESILKNGIYASVGFEYSNWWSYNGPNGEIPDDDELEYLVFLSTKPTTWSDNFYLDTMDIYEIDTKQLDKNCFYLDPTKDLALKGSICYTGNIPPSAIKLYDTKYFGKSVNENIEVEIAPEDVDLTSFNIKKKLNPKFWVDEHLDSRIRLKLLDISDDFIEYLGIDPNIVKDIIMTGSLANYNWNEKYSDIDLHVLLDYSDVDENIEFVKQYFMAQKTAWNNEHKDLKIFGFPIEVYVQDINEKHDSSGVYSLDRDKWLREPDRDVLATSKVNKSYIKDKVSEYTDKIDKLVYLYKKSKNDEYKLNKVFEKANALWDEIKNSRKIGFEKSGGKEINNENVIFKCLRRNKFLDKLYNLKTKTYDKLNSML